MRVLGLLILFVRRNGVNQGYLPRGVEVHWVPYWGVCLHIASPLHTRHFPRKFKNNFGQYMAHCGRLNCFLIIGYYLRHESKHSSEVRFVYFLQASKHKLIDEEFSLSTMWVVEVDVDDDFVEQPLRIKKASINKPGFFMEASLFLLGSFEGFLDEFTNSFRPGRNTIFIPKIFNLL